MFQSSARRFTAWRAFEDEQSTPASTPDGPAVPRTQGPNQISIHLHLAKRRC